MSKKHYYPSTLASDLVPLYLSSLATAHPSLTYNHTHRILLNATHSASHISLISGGGSGHEPAWSGYVGDGLLAAVACGDIFASPSMKQVLTAIAATPSEKGTILLITNYTGDKLHFGLAAERALAAGYCKNIAVLAATDDVSIGRSKSSKVGRRGLAGNVITMKILGAAGTQNYSFEECVSLGKAVNSQLVTIGSALDHCHVPGRQNHDEIPDQVCVIGAGIHNEPGAQKISPFPTPPQLITQLLTLLCSPDDAERAFVKFERDDDVVLLMNNYGGVSNLELGALMQEVLIQLEESWSIRPTKIYSGMFETSLNGPGFSITLCNLTSAAKLYSTHSTSSSPATPISSNTLLSLLATDTRAPSWPNVLANTSTKDPGSYDRAAVPDIETGVKYLKDEDIFVDPSLLERAVRNACQTAIAAEPDLTRWDMIMGDGDCGEAVKAVCEKILQKLNSGITTTGSLLTLLYSIIECVDDMGGTLGAILGILLAALATNIKSIPRNSESEEIASTATPALLASALHKSVLALLSHTGARVGDRTVMDTLIPFSTTFAETADFGVALETARDGAEGTRLLKAGFGRASYVGDGAEVDGDPNGNEEQKVPDPGAWALYMILKGMHEGIALG